MATKRGGGESNSFIGNEEKESKASPQIDAESLIDKDATNNSEGGIGFIGSLAIAVNYTVGPAMLDIPAVYQKSGLIPTTAAILLISAVSIACSLNLANVVSKIPGNKYFTKKIGYSDTFNLQWNRQWFIFTHLMFFFCLLCQTIASIVDMAQVIDVFIVSYISQYSYAIRFSPFPFSIIKWNKTLCPSDGGCDPFNTDENGFSISLGYIITAACFLPMALMDLKENTIFQIFGFFACLVICCEFMFVFLSKGINLDNVSLWGESWSELIGIILFNFTFANAIPGWLSEKSPNVSVSKIVYKSTGIATAIYTLIGCFGALAVPNISSNMLSSMIIGEFGDMTQIMASIFALCVIGLGIPVFCVLMRMNLVTSGLCNQGTGNFLGVYLSFCVSWLFYKGSAASVLLSWGGLLFTSMVSFIAPLLLALHTVLKGNLKGSIPVWGGVALSKKQESIALVFLLLIAIVLAVTPIYVMISESFNHEETNRFYHLNSINFIFPNPSVNLKKANTKLYYY